MQAFFNLLFTFYNRIFDTLFSATFGFNGRDVSVGSVLVCALIIGMVCSVFWRGARA